MVAFEVSAGKSTDSPILLLPGGHDLDKRSIDVGTFNRSAGLTAVNHSRGVYYEGSSTQPGFLCKFWIDKA